MLQFFKTRKFKAFLFVICALLMGCVLAIASSTSSSPVTRAVSVVFSPIHKAAGTVSMKLEGIADYFRSSASYKSENERLKQKIAEYENQLVEYNDIVKKLASYETMLGVKEDNPDFELCSAKIIGTDSADMFTSLIIDKGSSDSVAVNDPVVYGNYLVGIVKKVHPSYSVIESVLNPALNISAVESKTREVAYVTTTIEYSLMGMCLMSGLDRTTGITPGGIILTSGIGGLYPKGLIVGTVTEICESKFELSNYAVVEPGADVREIEDVFVITDFKGQGVEEIID